MSHRFEVLSHFYKERMGWPMTQVSGETILSVQYRGKGGQWVFVASTDEENDIVTLFARYPQTCPPERFNEMSEFLGRSNFGMTHGAWVMDRTDGEIRYRVGVDLGGLTLTDECLKNLTLYTNLTMERYLAGLASILSGSTAAEAFDQTFPN